MTLGDLLDGGFKALRSRPRTLLTVTGVFVVPVQMMLAFASREGITQGMMLAGDPTVFLQPRVGVVGIALMLLGNLAHNASLFLIGGAVTVVVTSWYTGGDPGVAAALRRVRSNAGPLLGAWALLVPVKIAASSICYLGLLVVVPLFALTAPAIVSERLGAVEGVKRSAQLVGRMLPRCMGIVLLATFALGVLAQVLMVPTFLVSLLLPASIAWVVAGVGASAAALLTTTVLVTTSVLLYLDLRVRTEGLDMELAVPEAFRSVTQRPSGAAVDGR